VVGYSLALVVVTGVGFAPLPRRVERALQRTLLRAAAWSADRVDWARHGWLDNLRRRLGTSTRFRRVTRLLLDDAIAPTDEAAGYVATVHPSADDEPIAWLERRLTDAGFHRNPAAYLEYRERETQEFEASSWVLRESMHADHQLHVRLFAAPAGAVDVYGHWEPAVAAGADHYARPDFRTGVGMMLAVLASLDVPFERREQVGGVTVDPDVERVDPPRPTATTQKE
jgi:hypothetical protein